MIITPLHIYRLCGENQPKDIKFEDYNTISDNKYFVDGGKNQNTFSFKENGSGLLQGDLKSA